MKTRYIWSMLGAVGIAGMMFVPPVAAGDNDPQGLQRRVEALESMVRRLKRANASLEHKLACISQESGSEEIYFEGCNVHVRNGQGETETVNGYQPVDEVWFQQSERITTMIAPRTA